MALCIETSAFGCVVESLASSLNDELAALSALQTQACQEILVQLHPDGVVRVDAR